MTTLEERIATSFRAQRLMETLGAQLEHVESGEVRISLPFSAALTQQQGFIHAGALTSIVDSACGYAALTTAPPNHEVVSAEFKINLLRPAIGTHFLAIGTVEQAGRLLTVCRGEVRSFQGEASEYKIVALMQATMVNVPLSQTIT
jgi:uncharacterized protein (TIGR00369 family)